MANIVFTVSVHRHMQQYEVEYLQFAFRWMNNLLMRELPLRCTIRLWDTYQVRAHTHAPKPHSLNFLVIGCFYLSGSRVVCTSIQHHLEDVSHFGLSMFFSFLVKMELYVPCHICPFVSCCVCLAHKSNICKCNSMSSIEN